MTKHKEENDKSKHISDKNIFGTKVTTFNDLIWVSPKKRNHIVKWCHNVLLNAGATRLIKTICTHFGLSGLQKDVKKCVMNVNNSKL